MTHDVEQPTLRSIEITIRIGDHFMKASDVTRPMIVVYSLAVVQHVVGLPYILNRSVAALYDDVGKIDIEMHLISFLKIIR